MNKSLLDYANFLKQLNDNCTLHIGQIEILKELLTNKKKYVFLNCGRNFGKTELALYFLVRRAIEMPNTIWYYICPTGEQAKEAIWDTRRIHRMIPEGYLLPGTKGIKESELSIHFKNGSSIYLKGSSQDPESKRGIKIDGCVYDEFRDFNPHFHAAFEPNFVKDHFQLLILSTPPSLEDIRSGKKAFYKDMLDTCASDPHYSSFTRPSIANPYIKDYIVRKKKELIKAKRFIEWEREYEAKIVSGSVDSIFPDIGLDALSLHLDMMKQIRPKEKHLEWFSVVDPSGQKRWGALFCAIDIDHQILYILDALTLTGKNPDDKVRMSAINFWAMIEQKMLLLYPGSIPSDWTLLYDSSEPWFPNELNIHVDNNLNFIPANKKLLSKTEGFGLIRDLYLAGRILISEKASELVHEFQALEINPITELPKKQYDELIDCLRYLLAETTHLFTLEGKPDINVISTNPIERLLSISQKANEEVEQFYEGFPDDFLDEDSWL